MTLAAAWAEKRRATGVVAPAPLLVATPPARRGRQRRTHVPAVARASTAAPAPATCLPVPTATPPATGILPASPRPPTPLRPRAEAAPPPHRPEREQRAAKPRPAVVETPKPRVTYKDIAGDEEVALIRRYQAGDRRAGDVLLQAHEPIVYRECRRYFNKGLDNEDVLQYGRMGFIEAIQRFDPGSGTRLTTYATYWVRHEAGRALQDLGATIRVPVHTQTKLYGALRRGEELDAGLAAVWSLRVVCDIDAPIGDNKKGETKRTTFGDMTADPSPGPEALVVDEDAQVRRRELIGRAMTCLTEQEQEVVRRMVLADDPETLEEVGASYGRTRERIRQIKVKAMGKLQCALQKLAAKDDSVLWEMS